MAIKKHLGTISIIVKDRQTHAQEMNELLTKNGHLILARLGVNVSKTCAKHCTGFIALAVEGSAKEINVFTKQLNDLYGIVAKDSIMTG